jgi:hypothetical protein
MDVGLVLNLKGFLMSDFVVLTGILFAVTCAVVGFVFYSVYGGSKASLANAKDGQVYNFVYQQPLHGTHERFLAKVVGKQTLTADQIARLNRKSRYRIGDPEFIRTANLVTCQTPDGKIRNFYAERVSNCRKPLLAKVLFKSGVASLL